LKVKYDKLPSNFAFNCNLRHYTEVDAAVTVLDHGWAVQLDPGLTAVDPALAFKR